MPALLADGEYQAAVTGAPGKLQIAILRLDDRILATDLPGVEPGDAIPPEEVRGAVPPDKGQIGSFFVPVRSTAGDSFLVGFRLPRRRILLSFGSRLGVVALELSLLLFSGIMSIAVIRHLRRGMGVLEEATRQIAAGNYDAPV